VTLGLRLFLGTGLLVLLGDQIVSASEFIPLSDFPEGDFVSSANAISADGSVVAGGGSRYPFPQANSVSDAFFWTESSGLVNVQNLSLEDSPRSYAVGAASNGTVVGTLRGESGASEAFRWTASNGIDGIGFLAGSTSPNRSAEGISSDGRTIVGWSSSSNGLSEAYYWTEELGMQGLGDLPGGSFSSQAFGISVDGSVIVGLAESEHGTEAFRWKADTGIVGLGDLSDGGYSAYATDVSDDGSVVVGSGSSANSGGALEAFRWTELGGFEPLGALRWTPKTGRADKV
jgi:probable HAF family extracellular repeat protein